MTERQRRILVRRMRRHHRLEIERRARRIVAQRLARRLQSVAERVGGQQVGLQRLGEIALYRPVGIARIGYGLDEYDGSDRRDERYVAALGITYKATRTLHIKGEVRQEWLRSSVPGADYTATVLLAGMRLQR